MPSLARSVPKPLKVPSIARSVTKPLKIPSLARSVLKPLLFERTKRVNSNSRSKAVWGRPEGTRRVTSRRQRGTSTESPKLNKRIKLSPSGKA